MLSLFAFILNLAISFGATQSSAAAPDKQDLAELQGAWKLVSIESNGKALELTDRQPRWVIQGDKVLYGGEDLARLTVDVKAMPKLVDLKFASPDKVYEAIYTIEKDTLKICLNRQSEGVKERPLVFSTKDKANWRLLVFERDKAEKEAATAGLTGFAGLALRKDQDRKEIVVGDVLPGSPAKKAGLRKDDVVLQIAGREVKELRSSVDIVRQTMPGSKITFRIRREGKESDLTVKVGVLPFALLAELD
jgi:uncharacterized protein (TIGR03067 family)